MQRESEQIRQWLRNERPPGAKGDDEAARKISRLYDLKHTTPLDRDKAQRDLDDSAFFHVQPCRCDKCDPERCVSNGDIPDWP